MSEATNWSTRGSVASAPRRAMQPTAICAAWGSWRAQSAIPGGSSWSKPARALADRAAQRGRRVAADEDRPEGSCRGSRATRWRRARRSRAKRERLGDRGAQRAGRGELQRLPRQAPQELWAGPWNAEDRHAARLPKARCLEGAAPMRSIRSGRANWRDGRKGPGGAPGDPAPCPEDAKTPRLAGLFSAPVRIRT
jgi:hypothetical protein